MIEKICHIVQDSTGFTPAVTNVIKDFQNQGLEVEVQYQIKAETFGYTALVIGRKKTYFGGTQVINVPYVEPKLDPFYSPTITCSAK